MLPGRVPLVKLNFNALSVDDNLRNLRVLEEAMGKLGVNKQLDVEALAKGRFKVREPSLEHVGANSGFKTLSSSVEPQGRVRSSSQMKHT